MIKHQSCKVFPYYYYEWLVLLYKTSKQKCKFEWLGYKTFKFHVDIYIYLKKAKKILLFVNCFLRIAIKLKTSLSKELPLFIDDCLFCNEESN